MLDVLTNQSFRRDLWTRGQPPIWPSEQQEALLATRCALLPRPAAREDGQSPYRYASSLGELTGKPEAYAPLYDALEAGPKLVRELLSAGVATPRTLGETMQILGLMLSAGHTAVLSGLSDAKPARALNQTMAEAALAGAPYRFQIAAALPHVLQLADTELMLLALWRRAPKLATAEALANDLVEQLVQLGRGLKDGETSLTTREEMAPRARALADAFLSQSLPFLQRIGVV